MTCITQFYKDKLIVLFSKLERVRWTFLQLNSTKSKNSIISLKWKITCNNSWLMLYNKLEIFLSQVWRLPRGKNKGLFCMIIISFLPCLRPGHFPFTSLIITIVLLKRLWGFTFWRNCAAQWSGETWKFGIKWIDTVTVKIPQLEDYRARSFLPWRRPNAWKVSFIIFLVHPWRVVRYQLFMFYVHHISNRQLIPGDVPSHNLK